MVDVKTVLAAGRSDATLNTSAAAKTLGISKSTLLRWFKQQRIVDVARDRNGWRVFTAEDISRIKRKMRL